MSWMKYQSAQPASGSHCLEGQIEVADKLLGYEFFFSGMVVHGDKLGKKLGYPTANLKVEDEEKIVPGNGIYAVYAHILERAARSDRWKLMNILQGRSTE